MMGFKLLCCSQGSQIKPSVSCRHWKHISLCGAWGREAAQGEERDCHVCLRWAELGLCGGLEGCLVSY